jgi:hypothetical protein
MKKRFTEEPIIGFLREADAGLAVKELLANSMLEIDAMREVLKGK